MIHKHFGIWMGALSLTFCAASAVGDNGIDINVTNDGTEDIIVTVVDMTIGPNAIVLPHARINGFTSIPISVSSDANGKANLAWTAHTVDSAANKCGHREGVTLANSSALNVHADSTCSS